jgi:predicted nucleotidyltransferase
MVDFPFLSKRMEFARGRLTALKDELAKKTGEWPLEICVYITGSYGRLEANEHSDLDLFFVGPGTEEKNKVPNVEKTLVDADLIRTSRELSFPEFTKGGIYLQIHYLQDILDALGSPSDDAKNYFTARMLLLLESNCIVNETMYVSSIKSIINSYYRDYHDHEVIFRPAFLVNDIHRYWITMCLNYEHARNRKTLTPQEKAEAHLKNIKLKYSRLLTCYSMILHLIASKDPTPPEQVLEWARLTPIRRLLELAEERPELKSAVGSVLDNYSWFLEQTGRDPAVVADWLSDPDSRDKAFDRVRDFGRTMFRLVQETPQDPDRLRYLVV